MLSTHNYMFEMVNWFDRESTTGFGLEVVLSFTHVGVAQLAVHGVRRTSPH